MRHRAAGATGLQKGGRGLKETPMVGTGPRAWGRTCFHRQAHASPAGPPQASPRGA